MFSKYTLKSRLIGSASLMAVALTGFSTTALAQDGSDVDEIIVTGSRIPVDPNLTSPVPVQSLTADDFRLSGEISLADVVNDVPALVSSTTAENSATGANALNLRGLGTNRTLTLVNGRRHVAGFAGSQAVDVGSIPQALVERVEVLTGGASAIYGSDAVTGVVNFILKEDFEGLDLDVRGGISDRGDAENFSIRGLVGKNFDGGKGNITIAVDVIEDSALFAGDRAFSRNNGIENDDFNPSTEDGAPPRIFLPQHTFSISSDLGLITPADFGGAPGVDFDGNGIDDCQESSVGQNTQFGVAGCFVIDADGTIRPFRDGLVAGFVNQFGGDGVPDGLDGDTLLPEVDTYTLNATASYEISPNLEAFIEGKYSSSTARVTNELDAFFDLLTITPENPFIPALLQPLTDSAGGLLVSRDPRDLGDQPTSNERETIRIVGGLKGEFARGLNFEISANYGEFTNEAINPQAVILDRFFASVDVIDGPNGPICRSDVDSATVPPGTAFNIAPTFTNGFFTFTPGDGQCQPLNILGGPFGASQEAVDFVTQRTVNTFEQTQTVLTAAVFGDSSEYFTLPAGAVGFAAGIEYREETSTSTFNPFDLGIIPEGSPLPAGSLISDTTVNGGLGFNGEARQLNAGGSFSVTDLFGEIRIPLVTGQKFFEDLSIDGAVRFADYSTLGLATTWKLGANWVLDDSLSFRGTVSQAIRAPNISELFDPESPATFRPDDPCDAALIPTAPDPELRAANCLADGLPVGFTDPLTARFVGVQAGDPNLFEETADTITIGGVYRPSFIDNLSITVDYWDVTINDALGFFPAQNIVNTCYDSSSFSPGVAGGDNAEPFCNLFTRNSDSTSPQFNGFNFLRQQTRNFARAEANGIDFAVNYSFGLGENNFGINAVGTRQLSLDNFLNPEDFSQINPALGELRRPKFSGNATLSWNRGPFAAAVQGSYQSRQSLAGVEIETIIETFGPTNAFSRESYVFDANASYEFNDNFTVYGGVNNFTDEEPLRSTTASNVGPRGRFLFAGVRVTY